MSRFFVFFALVLSLPLFAQAQNGCDQRRDPHSFACADATFLGQIFPLAHMNPQIASGPWKLLTYSPANGHFGPEFEMLENPENPHIPEGVANHNDHSLVGFFDWTPGRIVMNNWGGRGQFLKEIPGKTQIVDSATIETRLTGQTTQGLQCRMFLRNDNDHFLCRWYTLQNGQFVFRGYLGFLRGR